MNNILNRILIDWNDTDIKDSGLIKASDVVNKMKPQLVYKIDEQKRIRIFYNDFEDPDDTLYTYSEYKDKVYINGKHVQLDENGCTAKKYKPGEYRVYIEDFNKIEEIEDFTFYECTDLMSIIIPNSVTTIGSGTFWGCSGLTSVTIPNSVTLIDNSAFMDCTGLTSVTIPGKVKTIGDDAFSYCSGLTSITIPNSVTTIGNGAFSSCTGLTSITIPNSVTEIGSCVFYDSPNLKTIYVENINKFKKIKIGSRGEKTKLLGNVKLVELKNRLNESLIDWGNVDYSDGQKIISTNNVRTFMIFSGCDLMNYVHWLTYLDDKNIKTNLIHIVSSILNVLDKDQYFINRSAMHSSVLSNAHGEFKNRFVNKVLKNINPDIETFDDHHFLYWNIRKNPNDYHMFTNILNKLDRNLYSVFNARDLFGKPTEEDEWKQEYIILPMCPIEGKDILLLYFSIWNVGNNGEYSIGELGVVLNPVILE